MRTRLILVLCLVCLAHREVLADEVWVPKPDPPPAPFILPTREQARHDLHEAHVLRNVGIVTTVLGTVINLIGVTVLMTNLCLSDSGSCPGRSNIGVNAGYGLIGVGYAGVFAGIPLWAVGQTRASRAEKAVLSLSASGVRLTF